MLIDTLQKKILTESPTNRANNEHVVSEGVVGKTDLPPPDPTNCHNHRGNWEHVVPDHGKFTKALGLEALFPAWAAPFMPQRTLDEASKTVMNIVKNETLMALAQKIVVIHVGTKEATAARKANDDRSRAAIPIAMALNAANPDSRPCACPDLRLSPLGEGDKASLDQKRQALLANGAIPVYFSVAIDCGGGRPWSDNRLAGVVEGFMERGGALRILPEEVKHQLLFPRPDPKVSA